MCFEDNWNRNLKVRKEQHLLFSFSLININNFNGESTFIINVNFDR